MSVPHEYANAAPGDGTGSIFQSLNSALDELRAVVNTHLEEGALIIEATGLRLALAIGVTLLAALALMLAWLIACAAGLYYLSLATSPLWAVVAGVAVNLMLAVLLFRFACREIGRVQTYFANVAGRGLPRAERGAAG